MSFLRHTEIYQSDVIFSPREKVPPSVGRHRSRVKDATEGARLEFIVFDEFPAGYSLAGLR